MPPHPPPLPLLLLLLLLLPHPLKAFPEFRALIPNGLNTDNSGITCEHLGHNDCIPGAPRNPFGLDFFRLIVNANQIWRQQLCQLDSDGDGLTNGQELGDPCCVWEEGDVPARLDTLSHPGVREENGAAAAPACPDVSMSPSPSPSAVQGVEGGVPVTPSPSMSVVPDVSMSPSPSRSAVQVVEGGVPVTPSPSMSVVPEVSMSPEQEEGEGDDDEPVCFPEHAMVRMADGGERRMGELRVGDRVWVSEGETSEVFMFTHRVKGRQFEFVTLRAADDDGNLVASVSLTKGHYLYVNGVLEKAGRVRVGDSVEVGGVGRRVVGVEAERFVGLYNPQTVHGDLVVDGVRVSTYTTAVEVGLAHSLLAPLRLVYRVLGWSMSALEQGADRIVKLLP